MAAKKAVKSKSAAPARSGTQQKKDTRFKPGQSGNPKGRPKGCRDKINEFFLRDVLAAWEEHGVDAINKVAQADPVNFVKVVAGLIPKDVKIDGKIDHEHTHEHRTVSETANWIAGMLGSGTDRSPSKSVLQ